MQNIKIKSLISQALVHIQKKEYELARKILKNKTENLEVQNLIGLTYLIENKLSQAKECFEKILKIKPHDTASLQNLAKINLEETNYEKAYIYSKKLVQINENEINLINYASVLEKQKNHNELLEVAKKILNHNKKHIPSLNWVMMEKVRLEKFEEASVIASKILEIDKNHIKAIEINLRFCYLSNDFWGIISNYEKITHENRSNELSFLYTIALSELNKIKLSLEVINRLISEEPNNSKYLAHKGYILGEMGEYEKALELYQHALTLEPSNPAVLTNLGLLFLHTKNYEYAEKYLQLSVEKNNGFSLGWSNLGLFETKRNNPEKAVYFFKKALELENKNHKFLSNLGAAYELLNQPDLALEVYNQAISIQPNYAEAINNRGHLYLNQQNFKQGWQDYEARFLTAAYDSKVLESSKPLWNGNYYLNGPLYIWGEQGIGDQILHGSILPDISKLFRSNIVSVEKKLIPLFTRSLPEISFVEISRHLSEEQYVAHLPIASLGQYFRKSVDDFKEQKPYLVDNFSLTKEIKSSPLFLNRKTCGISWNSINQRVGEDKSISLESMLPILQLLKIHFINLQYGNVSTEIVKLEEQSKIKVDQVQGIDLYEDIDGLASVIQACDIIVTCSNSTAHLAGALGKETLLLLPKNQGKFWYWHTREDGRSLWYPSIKIYKQEDQGDWSKPVEEVKRYLEKRFE
jgi:tetratricopeptide (TPR) repeat protein/ADP-heptose:LPS heptosyltransferase